MAYSADFRKKVLEMREKHKLSLAEVALRFGVGVASVSRWTKQPAPKKTRNRAATKIDREKLADDVKKFPDSFHHERAERFGVSKNGICAALKRLGISQNKKSATTQSRRTRSRVLAEKNATEVRADRKKNETI